MIYISLSKVSSTSMQQCSLSPKPQSPTFCSAHPRMLAHLLMFSRWWIVLNLPHLVIESSRIYSCFLCTTYLLTQLSHKWDELKSFWEINHITLICSCYYWLNLHLFFTGCLSFILGNEVSQLGFSEHLWKALLSCNCSSTLSCLKEQHFRLSISTFHK